MIHGAQKFRSRQRLRNHFVGTTGYEDFNILHQYIARNAFKLITQNGIVLCVTQKYYYEYMSVSELPKIIPRYPSSSRITWAASGPSM